MKGEMIRHTNVNDGEANAPSLVVNSDTTLGGTDPIPYDRWAGGSVLVEAGSPIGLITWYGSDSARGIFLPAQDASGSAVTQTVGAGKGYPIPDVLYGYGALKAVTDQAGALTLSLKS